MSDYVYTGVVPLWHIFVSGSLHSDNHFHNTNSASTALSVAKGVERLLVSSQKLRGDLERKNAVRAMNG